MGELSVSPFEDLLIEHPSMSIYRRIDSSIDARNKTDCDTVTDEVNRNRKSISNKRESNRQQQSKCQSIEFYINGQPDKKSNQFSYMRKARDLNNVKKSLTLNKANSRSYNNAWSKRHYFTNFSYRR